LVNQTEISVKKVVSKQDLKLFVKLPWTLYTGNKHWVPPIISEQLELLTPGKNPFWDNAERELFLAYKGNTLVGRIAAIISKKYNRLHSEKMGFFGFYESINDEDVAAALYRACEQWLALRKMTYMRGPMNPNINETIGFLVEGSDEDPFVMMPYTLPCYPRLTEAQGFKKVKDVYAYWAETEKGMPKKVERIVKLLKKRYNIKVRHIDMKNLVGEASLIKKVHDEAWKENWGAVPFTKAEFEHTVMQLKSIAVPDLVPIVELDGKIVAMAVAVPDVNQILGFANGRLFPFGFLKVLFNQGKINRVRILILGVISKYRRYGFDALLYYEIFKAARKHGYIGGEFSWILEDNVDMIRIIERWGGIKTKTYRIYQKPIKKPLSA